MMWIRCPRGDISRAVAKIRKDRSSAVFIGPMGCTEEESTQYWVASLDNMTLNKRRGAPRDDEGQCAGCDRL